MDWLAQDFGFDIYIVACLLLRVLSLPCRVLIACYVFGFCVFAFKGMLLLACFYGESFLYFAWLNLFARHY